MGTRYRGKPSEIRALDAYIKLQRATKSIMGRLERDLLPAGVTETQFAVLEALHHLGPMCQRAVAEKILRSGANVTTVIDNLEKRDLVRRVRDKEDRRFVTVNLTEQGTGLVKRVLPGHIARIVEVFSALDPAEVEVLDGLCRKLGLSVTQKET